jgi:hypothetical protein
LTCQNNQCLSGGTGGGGAGGGSGGCSDVPNGWVDSDEDGCDWYADGQDRCERFGDGYANDGKTANQACCVCGGGSNNGAIFVEIRNAESPDLCLDLKSASTSNGNSIWHYPCNGTPAQKWQHDSNFYLRSAVDINKCIVGAGGDTERGTNLIINDCFANDDRFVWNYSSSDGTLRPKNNQNQCVGPSRSEIVDGRYLVHLWDCSGSPHQEWRGNQARRRERHLTDQQDCVDNPPGWYDFFGDNCEWYADSSNCEDYGSDNKKFGKTANQACCACGGGSTAADSRTSSTTPADFPPAKNARSCWDYDPWYDSVGDGCSWYAQGDNCQYYGDDFADPNLGLTAQITCCACGGGTDVPPPNDDEVAGSPPQCSNSPSRWFDEDGDGCDWYPMDVKMKLLAHCDKSRVEI